MKVEVVLKPAPLLFKPAMHKYYHAGLSLQLQPSQITSLFEISTNINSFKATIQLVKGLVDILDHYILTGYMIKSHQKGTATAARRLGIFERAMNAANNPRLTVTVRESETAAERLIAGFLLILIPFPFLILFLFPFLLLCCCKRQSEW